MKKLYYLFTFVAGVALLSACKPLSKTYDQLGDIPKPTATVPAPISVSLTLSAADYALLPTSNAAKTALGFVNKDAAVAGVPTILTSKYSTASEKSTVVVTYHITNPSVKLADSLYANILYTPTSTDYTSVTGKYADWSTAQAITFLNTKYPTPATNQMVVLNYTYYESGVTTSAGTANTIHSYLYMNGAWTKIYTISAAQYVTAGRGTYNEFIAADAANLPNIFNSLLKADPQVSAAPKLGDVIYVSYNYYASKDYQRVQPLTYDGTNWVVTPTATPSPLQFAKTNGAWAADNTVSYKLVTADYTYIASLTTTGASDAAKTNLAQYGDFNLAGTTSNWTDAQINTGLIAMLVKNFGSTAAANQKYVLTYLAYSGGTITATKTFQYNGSTFVFVQ